MSDASTTQSVECPICGDEFDPTVAGGWCTNTECGEWQYTETGEEQDSDDAVADDFVADDDDGFVSADEIDDQTDDEDDDTSAVFAEGDETEDEAEVDDAAAEPAATEDSDGDVPADEEADDEPAEALDDPVESADADAAEVDAEPTVDDAAAAESPATESEAEPAVESEADQADDESADLTADEGSDTAQAEADADDAAAETIDCPDCGVELDADANFCLECGADVSDVSPAGPLTACPGCGADVDEDANFCMECGEDLTAHRGDAASEDDADDAVEALASEDEPVPDSLVLVVEGREIAVDDGEKVGREIRAALMDAGRPEEEAVRIHREHVRFVRESDSFYLLDLGDNPTRLNGRTLTKGDREPVAPGDELELSGVAEVEIHSP